MKSFETKTHILPVIALLAVILGWLFWQSFLPGMVHFSNDGPLGVQKTGWLRLPHAMISAWDDLNSIGFISGVPLTITTLIKWVLGPVGYAKFLAPITLWIVGVCAWVFFRQLSLTPLASMLGAVAVALNASIFSTACWGVASQVIAFSMDFLALALVVSNSPATPWRLRWARIILAGLAVGMNIMEAADIGAILSLFVAAFILFKSLQEEGTAWEKIGRGVSHVAVVAVFAGFIAAHSIAGLVGTQIKGIVGTGQDTETKAQHWDWATQWSLPKRETLGFFVPGLFGYRMDTPQGGNYWGAMGRDPAWDRYFNSDKQGPPPVGFMRFTGGGNYVGVLVCVVAIWTMVQALRRNESVFSEMTRRWLWFWMVVLTVSLLLAFGRHAPFYRLLYMLPYFSTIRNPCKFLTIFNFAIAALFAYGIHGLSRRYMEAPLSSFSGWNARLKGWWAKAGVFDKRWAVSCLLFIGGSLLGWLIYSASRQSLEQYLETVQIGVKDAPEVASFSIKQVGWFILFLVASVAAFTLILSGTFGGLRAKWGGMFLGLLLVADLGRADRYWTVFWDYNQKYATNPIIDLLREKPYEHRVAFLPFRSPPQLALFEQLYRIEWAQHHFPYYNIQSLDVIQMPRMPEDLAAFENAMGYRGTPETLYLVMRRWQLTNTRYLLGAAGYGDVLNSQLDPGQRRFRIVERFDIEPKPGITDPLRLEELTVELKPNGNYALFEFTGALPRAKLYSNWLVSTNDEATLKLLDSPEFDPENTVLVSTPLPVSSIGATNQNPGTVGFANYTPTHITFNAPVKSPSVLLFNDKFDPTWQVRVDGKEATLLRCNFIMRGVYLTPRAHIVEFVLKPIITTLYVTLAGIVLGLLLIGYLIVAGRTGELLSAKPANGNTR